MSEAFEAEHQEALEGGALLFQRCRGCAHAWLPPREQCPACLAAEWSWESAAGRGHLVSWVVYHRAYHEDVAERVPYTVAIVELVEGPRVVAGLPEQDRPGAAELRIDVPLELYVGHIDGVAVPCVRVVEEKRP